MKRLRRHKPGTWCDLSPGTCFVNVKIPMPGLNVTPNTHPMIVINEEDEFVECVMAQTLECERENKFHTQRLERVDHATEILNPCPPMDSRKERRQYADLSRVIMIPKKDLYESTNMSICANQGDKLAAKELGRLNKFVCQFAGTKSFEYVDPFGYDDDSAKYDVSITSRSQIRNRRVYGGCSELSVHMIIPGTIVHPATDRISEIIS